MGYKTAGHKCLKNHFYLRTVAKRRLYRQTDLVYKLKKNHKFISPLRTFLYSDEMGAALCVMYLCIGEFVDFGSLENVPFSLSLLRARNFKKLCVPPEASVLPSFAANFRPCGTWRLIHPDKKKPRIMFNRKKKSLSRT